MGQLNIFFQVSRCPASLSSLLSLALILCSVVEEKPAPAAPEGETNVDTIDASTDEQVRINQSILGSVHHSVIRLIVNMTLSFVICHQDDRKMFIGGLSWETTVDEMKEYFTKYGDVKDAGKSVRLHFPLRRTRELVSFPICALLHLFF